MGLLIFNFDKNLFIKYILILPLLHQSNNLDTNKGYVLYKNIVPILVASLGQRSARMKDFFVRKRPGAVNSMGMQAVVDDKGSHQWWQRIVFGPGARIFCERMSADPKAMDGLLEALGDAASAGAYLHDRVAEKL